MKVFFSILVALLGVGVPAKAALPDCEAMAAQVGQDAGLPKFLLPTISRIESGRHTDGERQAWPWALNHAGKSLYFENRDAALDYLKSATKDGRTNIDVGCMQINHYWHGDEFQSLDVMLDPKNNVTYAAQFLKDLYQQHGSWAEAVKHYHSPDEMRGKKYLLGFDTEFENMKLTESTYSAVLPSSLSVTSFFNFGAAEQQPVKMGLGLLMSSTLKTQNNELADAAYSRVIAGFGSEVSNGEIWVLPVLNEFSKFSQVRGVLHAKWSQVLAMRKALSRN